MRYLLMTLIGLSALATGCVRVKMDPVEVKPITLNVNLKVDRELDDFFDYERQMGPATQPVPAGTAPVVPVAPAPAAQPAPPAPPATAPAVAVP